MSKPKAINHLVTPRGYPEDWVKAAYDLLDEILSQHHPELAEASIVLAWRYGWTPDQDGHETIGKCLKASDLNKELHGFDAVVLLNRDIWGDSEFTNEMKGAVIDHELSHLAPATDQLGEPKRDEHGRPVFRIRRHDIEEFSGVVERHGAWRHEIETFVKALGEARSAPLFSEAAREAE
jgi:hypothetical protein